MRMTPASPAFFATLRRSVFGGHLTQGQVDGLQGLLSAWGDGYAGAHPDPRWLAYILATAAHETGYTMQPIAERGLGAGHPYGLPDQVTGRTYYGRGYVQLTWKTNYARLSRFVGTDLVMYPERALEADTAAEILFQGMIFGEFTGAALDHYFNQTTDDPVGARRIINGTDCAEAIAGIHRSFLHALTPPLVPTATV